MLQFDDLFKMVGEVHKEYNALLPVEQQDTDRTGLMRLMLACCSLSKRSMVGSQMLRGKGLLPWKQSQKSQVCLEVCHQRGQVEIQAGHHQAQGHQRVIK